MLLGIKEAALDEEIWQKACELRVALPAIVVSFDAATQNVTVQPAIKESLLNSLVPTPQSLPQLANVPVIYPRGGGFSVTFPLVEGDEGVIVFQDIAIDSWWQSGGTNNVEVERRRHDLADAVFIPGGCSQPRKLSGYSASALEIRSDDGNTLIEVSSGLIEITPDGGTTQVVAVPGTVKMTPDGGTSLIQITPGEINLTAATVYINGFSYALHTHSGVTAGGVDTGPVVP